MPPTTPTDAPKDTTPPKETTPKLTPKAQQAAAKKDAEPRYKAGRVVQIAGTSYGPGQPLPNTFTPHQLFGVAPEDQPKATPIEEMANFDQCIADGTIVEIDDDLPKQPNLNAEAKAKGI